MPPYDTVREAATCWQASCGTAARRRRHRLHTAPAASFTPADAPSAKGLSDLTLNPKPWSTKSSAQLRAGDGAAGREGGAVAGGAGAAVGRAGRRGGAAHCRRCRRARPHQAPHAAGGVFSTARAACEGRVVCAWCFPQPPGRFIGEPPPLRCRPQGRATALPPAPMASPHMQICMLYFALHVLAWRLHSNSP